MPQVIKFPAETIWAGGPAMNGEVVLLPAASPKPKDRSHATVWLSGAGTLQLHSLPAGLSPVMSGHPSIELIADGKPIIRLDAAANVWIGGNGQDGDLVLFSKDGDNKTAEQATLHLNGDAGDITLRNADCAEEFDLAEFAESGTAMIVGEDGRLSPSAEAYDHRVVGVISGAGGTRPGIVLGRKDARAGRAALAVAGTVHCKVDASEAPIGVGDLLTTSPTVGHAMKASDPTRAFGAVLGKAMAALPEGLGLIPVLVALQ